MHIITGTITRVLPADADCPDDRIFFFPQTGEDLSRIDGKCRTGGGELIALAHLEGRKVGDVVRAEVRGEGDEQTLAAL